MDMQQLFAAAQQMQEQLMNAQQALADAEVTGTAGGGLVKATVNGQGELLDLSIQPAAVDTDDAEETARTIADLVLAAVRDAYRAAEDLQQQQMGPFAAAMQGGGLPGGLDLPSGLDLSGLGIGGSAHDHGAQTRQGAQPGQGPRPGQDPGDEDKPQP